MNKNWSCIVITCSSLSSVIATEREIEFLKKKGRIPSSVCVLTIEDPAKNLGSGAATLNALLMAVEYLSAKQNYMVLTSDVLLQAHILILHNGRDYLYSCSGKAFTSLPLEYVPEDKSKPYCCGILNNLEAAFQLIDQLSFQSPYGVWVCSTDMLILQKEKCYNPFAWENVADVVMFCIHTDIEYATNHGVISIDNQGYISDIFYCRPFDQIKSFAQGDGKVPIISGIVFLKTNVAESLLSLHVQAPLDSCTYLGLDCGNQPIQVSLFFDLLIAMATNMTKEAFISGKCGKTYNNKFGIQASYSNESMLARSLVWKELNSFRMSATEQNTSYHVSNLLKIASTKEVHSVFQIQDSSISNSCLLLNSCLEAQMLQLLSHTVIIDSFLRASGLKFGENCFISGVTFCNDQYVLNIPDNLCIMHTSLKELPGKDCFILFGIHENPFLPVDLDQGTFCNKSWSEILRRLCIGEDEIWALDLSPDRKTLMNAKLFTCNLSLKEILDLFLNENKTCNADLTKKWKNSERFSLGEIMENINYCSNFDHKRQMHAEIACRKIRNSICENKDIYLLPYFYASCAENWSESVMNTLDDVLLSDVNSVIKTRTLSCIADLLSIKAGITGGLRSGPGSNRTWNKAFTLLLNGNVAEGLKELLRERSHWLSRPDHLMRAARHYERAAQIFIQNSVKTVKEFMILTPVHLPEIGVQVTAECPARIDLQGGWSDTPPICYELGGSVVNIALLIDGKKPIGSRAFRIREPYIVLNIGLGEMIQELVIKDMKDVLNYDQPNAQGALLKAALICTNIVNINCEKSLEEQLLGNFGGGFEIQSWSNLPQGCGMGTSSILAGAIVAVLWSVTGKSFDKSSVIHAVLYIEQLLTTGGGWQDQVSGITGGINRGYSEPALPVHVKVEPIQIETPILEKLNAHFLLIYTGKVRLAKNLLQNVIRNWYAREETIVQCFKALITYSFEMKAALLNGNLPEIGQLMEKYWEQKKILAPGSEPASVKEIMDIIKPFCYGQLLAGAGGGGFMCILTKEPNAKEMIKTALQKYKDHQKLSIHNVTIHKEGLEITV
ncbi:L-fucose kinase like protein [Argiope bruennichi]|uniref:L-fucose kinase like protein n=1 Tax=Argiope bruennichi TaxID=94029 RepID=A0A8T0F7U3_ARGBR|nr:L-fucose kinase like protein [Argiope bruennichi]